MPATKKRLYDLTIAEIDAIPSLDEVLKLEREQEQECSDELAKLDDQKMTKAERLAKRRELNDETRRIHRAVHIWRKLHKPSDAGPDQDVQAVTQDLKPTVGEG